MSKITKQMTIGEVINQYPELAEFFLNYGFHCIGCFASDIETIEQGAKAHGLSEQSINKMLAQANKIINKKNGKRDNEKKDTKSIN